MRPRALRAAAWVFALSASSVTGPTRSADAAPGAEPGASRVCGGGRRLTAHFYDVGQGLAVLVDLPDGRHILVDAGDSPRRPECGFVCAAKNRHLLERLHADLHGAPIDLLWITHQHSDHIGGAPEVLESLPVVTYVDNGRDEARGEVRRAHQAAERAGVTIRVVDPSRSASPIASSRELTITPILPSLSSPPSRTSPLAWPPSCAGDANECSIALRIDYCSSSLLFTGDAERREEASLDTRGPVTLLQVAHHGSETSSSPRFLERASPRYAVISAGKPDEGLNRDFCHPRALVVERLTRVLGGPTRTLLAFAGERCDRAVSADWTAVAASDRLWATEQDGDVVLSTVGDGLFARD